MPSTLKTSVTNHSVFYFLAIHQRRIGRSARLIQIAVPDALPHTAVAHDYDHRADAA